MIIFNLSKPAQKALKPLLQPATLDHPGHAQHWYLHLGTVGQHKVFCAAEKNTRYCSIIMLKSLRRPTDFPQEFAERYWKEAAIVVQHFLRLEPNHHDLLCEAAQAQARDMVFQPGYDASIMGVITDALALLSEMVHSGYTWPTKPEEAIAFGFHANQRLRAFGKPKTHIIPVEAYFEYWMNQLHERCSPKASTQAQNIAPGTNTIAVDFVNKRRLPNAP
jgi:hypothetical protein